MDYKMGDRVLERLKENQINKWYKSPLTFWKYFQCDVVFKTIFLKCYITYMMFSREHGNVVEKTHYIMRFEISCGVPVRQDW